MIKNIIFDFDGVLVDSVEIKTKAFSELYKEYGNDVVIKVVEHHRANGGVSRHKKIKYYHGEFLGVTLTDDEVNHLAERFSSIVKEKVIEAPEIKGAHQFLNDYSEEYLMFICSGTPDKEIQEIITRRGMGIFFQGIYGSPKTKEILVEEIISGFKLTKKQTLFVGDTLNDFDAASLSKIRFIGVSGDSDSFPPKTMVIPDLTKLSEVLQLL